MTNEGLLIAKGQTELRLLPRLANRHGLIAGATGTGKTVTLQVMAENFSRIGVPVFMADVKGDLAGISRPGAAAGKVQERLALLGISDYPFAGCPVAFWDIFGEQGHPVRTTVTDMGPLLLGRLLNLNEVQAGVLSVAFRAADDAGLLLLDFKDLRSMVQYAGDNAGELETAYGRVSSASVGAIQRSLLVLEDQGGDRLFGEPALELEDFMQTDVQGRGYINILAANRLMLSPKMYATFLLWLLSELFERLPEVGDQDKPRLVFFFDEAHLLFEDAPPALMEKIEQVVRLIRSKGVGVYFITQNPIDIPDDILGQLGNRVQHALRAFTPRDQKAVRAMAETFRQNPAVDVETAVTQLAVGEGLVSFLDEKGQPGIVERAWVLPPASRIGTITPQEREAVVRQSLVYGRYENATDRDSAYEMLKARAEARVVRPAPESRREIPPDFSVGLPEPPMRGGDRASYPGYPAPAPRRPAGRRDTLLEAMAKSAARSVGSSLGRSVLRGVLGSILGGRR